MTGLILSSFGKLLHIVTVIWDYNDLEFSYLINITVFTSNIEAISGISSLFSFCFIYVAIAVIFSINYQKSVMILSIAILLKYLFQLLIVHFDPSFPASLF